MKKRRVSIPLTRFGVDVRPAAEWPYPSVGGIGKTAICRMDTRLATTQKTVDAEVVAQKERAIKDGEAPVVSVVYRGGRTWVFDGHHALAAYRKLGRPAPCFFHAAGFDQLAPPRLRRKGKVA